MDLLGLRLVPSLPEVCDSTMALFPGGLQRLLSLQVGVSTEGRTDLLFGLFCRLPTEQETHPSTEREMSPTWLPQACVTSLIRRLSLCSAGVVGAGTLRRDAVTHSFGGTDWPPSKLTSLVF